MPEIVNPQAFEEQHVHSVYNEIASHFSMTRYKPWPVIKEFIEEQKVGSIGGDIGCGNGKYMNIRPQDVAWIGCDRSSELVSITALEKKLEAFVADGLRTPFRSSSLDFVISVAVIHHFSTKERRKKAVEEVLRVCRSGGRVLIYVWAMEQEKDSKRVFTKQDELVSWKTRTTSTAGTNPPSKSSSTSSLAQALDTLDLSVTESQSGDSHIAQKVQAQPQEHVLHRYYHLFYKGELEDLCTDMPCLITKSGYDRDNHYVILTKK